MAKTQRNPEFSLIGAALAIVLVLISLGVFVILLRGGADILRPVEPAVSFSTPG